MYLKPLPKAKWVDDECTNKCNNCRRKIRSGSQRSNKHHCRYCGHIVCRRCSKNTVNNLRICNICLQQMHQIYSLNPFTIPLPTEALKEDRLTQNCTNCHKRFTSKLFTSNRCFCSYCGQILCTKCCPFIEYNCMALRTCNQCQQKQMYILSRSSMSRSDSSSMTISTLHGFDELKYFILDTELLVYGYIREYYQSEYYYIILTDNIIQIMILYIQSIANESWDRMNSHSDIIITRGLQCIEVDQDSLDEYEYGEYGEDDQEDTMLPFFFPDYYHVFGTDIVKMGDKKTWIFHIEDIDPILKVSNISIGIVDINKINQFKCNYFQRPSINKEANVIGYGLQLNGGFLKSMDKMELLCGAANGLRIKRGDIITMTLDMTWNECGMLHYSIQQICAETISKIAFHPNINKKWKLAVKLHRNDKLCLLETLENESFYCECHSLSCMVSTDF